MDKKNFRIYLRALEINDHLTTVQWRHDPAYLQGVVSTKRYISSETEKEWMVQAIKSHEQIQSVRLAIVLKKTDDFIGMIYLTNIDKINRRAVVGSLIGSEQHRGKGYVFEARYLLFEYAFNELGLNRISANILEDNVASRNSVEKFGYIQEGILRDAVFKDGAFRNLVAYAMLKNEFLKKYKLH
jgi:[ribosomal protein S5]-alanine N-acetyltransferase